MGAESVLGSSRSTPVGFAALAHRRMNQTRQQNWVDTSVVQEPQSQRLDKILGVILWASLLAILVLVG